MSVWSKIYERINWKDLPQRLTALAARNLNKMDLAIDTIDDRVIALDNGKVSSVTVTNTLPDGDTIATITVDGTPTAIKSKQPNEQEMNVRSAMLLLSPTPIGENAPFVKRRSGGNVPFPALLKDKIIGASAVWNQLIKNGNFADTSNWSGSGSSSLSFTVADNIATLECLSAGDRFQAQNLPLVKGHKYLFSIDCWTDTANSGSSFILYRGASDKYTYYTQATANVWETKQYVVQCEGDTLNTLRIRCDTQGVKHKFRNIHIHDLTAMFGSTIANYVNTLETQTAGSGIEWLKSYGFFTESYYAYSANKIESVSVSAKKYTGKNLCNPANISVFNSNRYFCTTNYSTTPMIPVKANTQYVLSCRKGTPSNSQDFKIYYWDSNNTAISNEKANPFTTPSNCVAISFYCGYSDGDFTDGDNVKAQVEFGSTATPYEPYKEWQTALDHTTLRGLFKLDANNNLYADGDIYPSDGNGEVKWNEWNLGDFTWTRDTTRQIPTFYCTLSPTVKSIPNNWSTNFICENYLPSVGATTDKTASIFVNSRFYICDSAYTDATAFGNAMSGVKLVAELNTPTTQNLTPYPDLQNIASGGTEEFIDYQVSQENRDVSIPVGGEREYYQGMDLPALPTASGNHNLQFNPSSGFSWS